MKIRTLFSLLFLIIFFVLAQMEAFAQSSSGYFNKTKIGFLPGIDKQPNSAFKQRGTEIVTVNGIHLDSKLAVGLGVGILGYVNPTLTLVPIFASVDYALIEKRSAPYVYGNFGYSISTNKGAYGGFMGEGGAGWKFGIGKNTFIGPEAGYRYQSIKYKFLGAPGGIREGISSIFIGAAITF